MKRHRWILLFAALAIPSLGSCARCTRPVAPAPGGGGPPVASSSAQAVRRLQWAVAHGDLDAIAGLLAADFTFAGAGVDSAGHPARVGRDREWVLVALRSMLQGVPGKYEPAKVGMTIDPNLIAYPDTRPGRDPGVRKQIRTSLDMRVDDPGMASRIRLTGNLLFFATRGDSASIPADQTTRGAAPDSSTWWIDGWEDETLAGPLPFATHPAAQWSLSALLEYYWLRAVR